MTPNLIRIVAAACLGAALVPAQEEHDVIVRKVTQTKNKAGSAKKNALVLKLVEKLSDGDLSKADRMKCKKQLIELLGSVDVKKDALLETRPILSKLRRAGSGDEEVAVVVEVEDGWHDNVAKKVVKAKGDKPTVRWNVDKANNIARIVETVKGDRARVLAVKPTLVEDEVIVEVDTAIAQDPKKAKRDLGARATRLRALLDKSAKAGDVVEAIKLDDDDQVVIRYRAIEDAERAVERAHKAHAEAMRAHEEAMKVHVEAHKLHEAHGHQVLRLRKGQDAKPEVIYFGDYGQDPVKAKSKKKAKSKNKNKKKGKRDAFTFEVAPEGAARSSKGFFTFEGKGKNKGKAKGQAKNRFFVELDGQGAVDIEGIEEHIAKAMEKIEGNAEVEFDVLYHDEHGKPGQGKARAYVRSEPGVGLWVQGKDKPSKGGIYVVGGDEKGATYKWVERAERHVREEHEHGHHAHEEHEHGEHEHAEHEEECEEEEEEEFEEIEEEVEELTEMIEEMREEMRELREMMQQIREMLRGHERHEGGQGDWRRVSGRRGEFVAPSRVRYTRERRNR